jgi:nucleoid-associated protein YgaU
MLPTRMCLALLAAPLFSGCGYIHFGRLEKSPVGGGDAALVAAYSNLSTEHKILKQELVLVRREGDALRTALERGASATGAEAAARLNEASRELATLRAAYAKLQGERTSSLLTADPAPLRALEDKLAASLRQVTQLQEENSRLRAEVERTRGENTALTSQLTAVTSRHEESRQALEMLNSELLAQKQARAQAEQAATAARTQLSAVLAQANRNPPGTLAAARESAAASSAALHLARSPTSDSVPTAELRTDTERLRRAAEPSTGHPAPATPRPATHLVQAGDTLEKLALRYYGSGELWRPIYEANLALLGGGQPLRVGTELRLP